MAVVLVFGDGNEDVLVGGLLGQAEGSREQGLEERLLQVAAEARHLARATHLYSKRRIRAAKTREGEHRRLHSHVVNI